jgi:hypothetical protein
VEKKGANLTKDFYFGENRAKASIFGGQKD